MVENPVIGNKYDWRSQKHGAVVVIVKSGPHTATHEFPQKSQFKVWEQPIKEYFFVKVLPNMQPDIAYREDLFELDEGE